jgi:peptidyl-prolyl cis-trans isomerase SurA
MAALSGVFVLALAAPPILAEPAVPSAPARATAPAPASDASAPQSAADGTRTMASTDDALPSAPSVADAVVSENDGVAAVVNDTVISQYDLRQRVALFLATTGARPTKENIDHIHDQVLKQLETERLELLEAQKNNITVSGSEVDKAISNITSDNNMTLDQLKGMLEQAGVNIATLRSQIATQIAWSKTVQGTYGEEINITPSDIDAELKTEAATADKPHYQVAEIFQSVDNPEQDSKVQADMQELHDQIQQGAPFQAVARQFSQNPTAAQGGDLGWMADGQLPQALNDVLRTMEPGNVSPPIRGPGGYYILFLRGKQAPAGTKIPEQTASVTPDGMLPLARVLLPIGDKPDKDLVARAMQAAEVIRQHIEGCDGLDQLTKKVTGSVYMNLGTMRVNELSPQIQAALTKTQPGDVAEPFQSPAGIEIIVRCDKALPQITAFHMPTRDDIEQELFEEQMSVLARRYLRDLRRDADIETR